MGRLWQTLILMEKHPVFEFLPNEALISNYQEKNLKAAQCIKYRCSLKIFIHSSYNNPFTII